MKPTPAPWTYNPDFAEVQCLERILAKMVEAQEGAPEEELHANGYLMAASVELRDELNNLSRAVATYLNHDPEEGCEGIVKERRLFDNMEVMLQRAEHTLEHIFPPEERTE